MDTATSVWSQLIKPAMQQQFRMLPDAILLGSGLMAILTQSYSTTMFFISMLETSVVGGLFRSLMTFMDMRHTAPGISEDPTACDASLSHTTMEDLFTFGRTNIHSAFPSFPILFLATAVSYVVNSLWNQKQELEELGSNFAARFYIAVILAGFFLFTMASYRIGSGCEGAGIIILTLLLGVLLGWLLLNQNLYLFGRDSINMTGVPLLRERTKDGKPLYVCTQQVSEISELAK